MKLAPAGRGPRSRRLLAAGLAARLAARRAELARDERALTVLTSSDAEALRLTAAPGSPAGTHATYRFRAGSTTAVLTFSNFPPAAPGQTYQAWALRGGRWIALGRSLPDAAGKARLIIEGPEVATRPEALEVTRESVPAPPAPTGPVVVRWPAPEVTAD